jgi:hypothetical protein
MQLPLIHHGILFPTERVIWIFWTLWDGRSVCSKIDDQMRTQSSVEGDRQSLTRELSLRGRQAVAIPRLLRHFIPRNDNLGPVIAGLSQRTCTVERMCWPTQALFPVRPGCQCKIRELSLRAKRSNLSYRTRWEDIRDCFVASLLAMTSWGLSFGEASRLRLLRSD